MDKNFLVADVLCCTRKILGVSPALQLRAQGGPCSSYFCRPGQYQAHAPYKIC